MHLTARLTEDSAVKWKGASKRSNIELYLQSPSPEFHPRRPRLLLHFPFHSSSTSIFPRKNLTSVRSHPPNNQPKIRTFLAQLSSRARGRSKICFFFLFRNGRSRKMLARSMSTAPQHWISGTEWGNIVCHGQDCWLGNSWNWVFGVTGNGLPAVTNRNQNSCFSPCGSFVLSKVLNIC